MTRFDSLTEVTIMISGAIKNAAHFFAVVTVKLLMYRYFVRRPLYGVCLTYTTFWKIDSFLLSGVKWKGSYSVGLVRNN
jgi:hypothetical protein